MIMTQPQGDYGSLAPLVKTVGWLVSATAAIAWSFRRRAKWEPSEEDVAQGPARVGGVLTAVAIAIIWSRMANVGHLDLLMQLAIYSGLGALVFLLTYSFLIATKTYTIVVSPAKNRTVQKKIIGGFHLTDTAQGTIAAKNLTVQDFLAGSTYDADKVWTRGSRALAKLCFVVGYIGLTVAGSVALTCAAILLLVTSS